MRIMQCSCVDFEKQSILQPCGYEEANCNMVFEINYEEHL